MLFAGDFAGEWGNQERNSVFCFIGRNLDKMGIEEGFRSCIVSNNGYNFCLFLHRLLFVWSFRAFCVRQKRSKCLNFCKILLRVNRATSIFVKS